MAHGHFDASVSSLVAPESGAAAPEVMSPDIVGKRCGRKSSELNTLEKIKEPRKNSTPGGSYQHCNGQKKNPFTDDAPQHFQQPDRSLHPTVASIANAR